MSANVAALLYLAAGVLFILALRGLSSPASSRRGNLFGMIGMTIAVLTTLGLAEPTAVSWILILAGPRHRRLHRRQDGARNPDDDDAGTRRGVSFSRRSWPPCSSPRARSTRRLRSAFSPIRPIRRSASRAAACSRWRSASPSVPSRSRAPSSRSRSSRAGCRASRSCCRCVTSSTPDWACS